MSERPLSRQEAELLRVLARAHRNLDERCYPSADALSRVELLAKLEAEQAA